MADVVKDPVCGMDMSTESAVAKEEHGGLTLYFCSDGCHQAFLNDPHRFGHPH